MQSRTQHSINSIEITQNDVVDVLKILTLNKTTGNDKISHNMLKNTAETVCYPLQILINRSLQECKFPCQWKLANVLPLYTKSERFLLSNYRPISLLSSVSKIL